MLLQLHLHLMFGFNILCKDHCKPRRETFRFWDLVHLILEIIQYVQKHSNDLKRKIWHWYGSIVVTVHLQQQDWHVDIYRYRPDPEFQQLQNWHYCQISNIRHTKSPNLNVSPLAFQLSLSNPLRPCVQSEWRWSWRSADRQCSNHIRVINNVIAY